MSFVVPSRRRSYNDRHRQTDRQRRHIRTQTHICTGINRVMKNNNKVHVELQTYCEMNVQRKIKIKTSLRNVQWTFMTSEKVHHKRPAGKRIRIGTV